MRTVVASLVDAAPDAIQLSPGQAHLLQETRGPKPALVMRADVANVYGQEGLERERLFSYAVADAVEHAVRLDAACVCVNLLAVPGEPELHEQCVRNVSALRSMCTRYGMALMVEPLAMKRGESGYGVNGDTQTIVTLVRQAVELGADVIKADPTDDLDAYSDVLAVAGDRPVLVRGGGRVSDDEILERTRKLIAIGAAGIVYGRNVVQHPRPAEITRALMAIVHDG
jgi:DhnA family fructose-bisphosphate aldolase class Ia